VVKLLSKRWWISVGARHEGPKLEPEGLRAEVGLPTPTWGFRAFKALCLAFVAFNTIVFDAWIIPSTVMDPSEKVSDLNFEVAYRICY